MKIHETTKCDQSCLCRYGPATCAHPKYISGSNQKNPSASHSNSKRVLWVWATCKNPIYWLRVGANPTGWLRTTSSTQMHSFLEQPWYAKFNSLLAPYSQGSALLDESRACACSKLLKKPWVKSKWGEVCEWKLIENRGWSWKTMIEKCAKFWIGQLNRFAVCPLTKYGFCLSWDAALLPLFFSRHSITRQGCWIIILVSLTISFG